MRKPFFWKSRQCWYVKIDDRNVKLDPSEDKAFTLWNRMRELAQFQDPNATIEAICEAFLSSIKPGTKSEARFAKITNLCAQFCLHVGPDTQARTIRAHHVIEWLNAPKPRGDWSIARKRDGGQVVKRVFRWAINEGILPHSNVLGIRLEQPDPRDTLIPYDVHRQLVLDCRKQKRSRPFGLVLIALWNSGARPIQIRNVTAKHITEDGDWQFKKHKTKGKTAKSLLVRPSPCLATLVSILQAKRPTGNLFLNWQGQPWTKDGIARRLSRMKARLEIDLPFTAYSYRHTFTTDALLAGVDLTKVAALLGHSDAAMVARVYGHVGKHGQPLRDAAASSVSGRKRG